MSILEGAKENFEAAHGTFGENTESEFYHKIARLIPESVTVDNLILIFRMALNEAERNNENVVPFIALVPRYIEQFATPEFSIEFRKKYNEQVLGLILQDQLPDTDYGIVEVEEDVIDISNKSRAAVLAALYNESTPVGAGFIQYNPVTWNETTAQYYLEHIAEPLDDGGYFIKYVLGRDVEVYFKDNLVYVRRYNLANGYKKGQRVISTVPDITPKKDGEVLSKK